MVICMDETEKKEMYTEGIVGNVRCVYETDTPEGQVLASTTA